MSLTFEIPRENWSTYLDELNKNAKDHTVRVEVMNRELGDQELAESVPLVGVDFETKGSMAGSIDIVAISPSKKTDMDHRIAKPEHVYIKANDAGQLETIAIEESSGGTTFVYFEELPMLPSYLPAGASQPQHPI